MINWIEGPQKAGVFVNQPLDDVNMIARQTGVDLVQLHGNEAPEYCSLVEKPIIKAVHVRENSNIEPLKKEVEKYKSEVEFILFDTGSSNQWGGTGQTFDWSLLREVDFGIPFFLSGGLNPENIQEAVKTVQPEAIDVCSGLESKPGKKNFDKVEEFINVAREAYPSK